MAVSSFEAMSDSKAVHHGVSQTWPLYPLPCSPSPSGLTELRSTEGLAEQQAGQVRSSGGGPWGLVPTMAWAGRPS